MKYGTKTSALIKVMDATSMPITTALHINENSYGKQYASAALFDGMCVPAIGGAVKLASQYLPAAIGGYVDNFGSAILMYGLGLLVLNFSSAFIFRND